MRRAVRFSLTATALYTAGWTSIRPGTDGAIIAYGGMLDRAINIRTALAQKHASLAVINMPCVAAVDEETMGQLLQVALYLYV